PGNGPAHHGRLQGLQPRGGHYAHCLARPPPHGFVCFAHLPDRPRQVQRRKGGSGMKRWLRQHRYAIAVAVRRLLAQPFSSLANLLVIALTLTVPILGASILITAQPVARQLSVSPEMTIFLSPKADAEAGAGVAQRLKDEFPEDVDSVNVVKRDAALAKLRANPNWAQALAALP